MALMVVLGAGCFGCCKAGTEERFCHVFNCQGAYESCPSDWTDVGVGSKCGWGAPASCKRKCKCVNVCPPPSASPTRFPTDSPTAAPTRFPTTSPTVSPTIRPTSPPSQSPTPVPTVQPSTSAPTDSPTTGPNTSPPSATPTRDPTRDPTTDPTRDPTTDPTASPTWPGATDHPTGPPNNSPPSAATMQPASSPDTSNPHPPTVAPSAPSTMMPTPGLTPPNGAGAAGGASASSRSPSASHGSAAMGLITAPPSAVSLAPGVVKYEAEPAKFMSVVSIILLAVGLLFAPALSTTAAAAVGCDGNEGLPVALHPAGVVVSGSEHLGCLTCFAIVFSAASLVGMLISQKGREDGGSSVRIAVLLHPNLALTLGTFLYQGAVIAASRLCFIQSSPLGSQISVAIGVPGLLFLLLFPFAVFRAVRTATQTGEPRAQLRPTPQRRGLAKVFAGDNDWVGVKPGDDWLLRWRVVVRRFTMKVDRGILYEFFLMFLTGILLSAGAKDLGACARLRTVAAVLHAVCAWALVTGKWYRTPLGTWASALRTGLLTMTFATQAMVYFGVAEGGMALWCDISFLVAVAVVVVHATGTFVSQIILSASPHHDPDRSPEQSVLQSLPPDSLEISLYEPCKMTAPQHHPNDEPETQLRGTSISNSILFKPTRLEAKLSNLMPHHSLSLPPTRSMRSDSDIHSRPSLKPIRSEAGTTGRRCLALQSRRGDSSLGPTGTPTDEISSPSVCATISHPPPSLLLSPTQGVGGSPLKPRMGSRLLLKRSLDESVQSMPGPRARRAAPLTPLRPFGADAEVQSGDEDGGVRRVPTVLHNNIASLVSPQSKTEVTTSFGVDL
eukprot:Hpha_TRINITY_DN4288_c0_g1::TRINITY_DN4288_c0_g1_i1::g.186712::m.186712